MAKPDLFCLIAKQTAIRNATSVQTTARDRRKLNSETRKREIGAERDRQALLLLEEHRASLFHINEVLDNREKVPASSSFASGERLSPSGEMEQLREFRHYVGELEQSDFPDLSDKEYLVKTRQRVAEQWEATCQRCGQLMRDVVRHKSELQQHRRDLEQLYPLIFLRDRMRAGRFWFDGGVTRLRIGLGFGAFILLLSILSLGESRYQYLLFVVTGGFLLCLLGLFCCSLMQKDAKDKLRQELDLLCKSEDCPPPVIAKDYFDLDGVEHLIPNDLATIVYGKRYRTKGKSGHPERDTSQEAEREAAKLTGEGLIRIADAIESELRGIGLQLAELDRELGWRTATQDKAGEKQQPKNNS